MSNQYADGKWRIVCDPRRKGLNELGDFTFDSRDTAASGQRKMVSEQARELQVWLAGQSAFVADSTSVAEIIAA
uniref:Uncharacterized protein n=1 Tax=Pseudomonas fluorescens (strain SBW25) TaxID=216595 RepID=A0A0G4E4Z5_PSEFS|nr:hypothetical protein [Pseudomonas fluorescens]CEK42249.1 hypothetical protein PQBR57_0296 [Pseudomonas fluorescens SBW25]